MILLVLITGISTASFAQTWQQTWGDMTKEEKMSKLKSYREDNQKFLKDSLGMTCKQLKSIDSVNSVFLKEMRRIENSTASDDDKLAKAKEIAKKRGDDLDQIMGEESITGSPNMYTINYKRRKGKDRNSLLAGYKEIFFNR